MHYSVPLTCATPSVGPPPFRGHRSAFGSISPSGGGHRGFGRQRGEVWWSPGIVRSPWHQNGWFGCDHLGFGWWLRIFYLGCWICGWRLGALWVAFRVSRTKGNKMGALGGARGIGWFRKGVGLVHFRGLGWLGGSLQSRVPTPPLRRICIFC